MKVLFKFDYMTLKEIISKIRESWIMAKALFNIKMDGLRLSFAIYMADSLQKARNKRFYVVENGHGRLIWLCNDDIKLMKQPRIVQRLVEMPDGSHKLRKFKVRLIPKEATHSDIMRDCYYYTPASRNNEGAISWEERESKRKKWIEYMERYRMDRMLGKRKIKVRK